MKNIKYVYPKLSTIDFSFFGISGPGLGNMLFPWARAVIYSKKNNIKMLAPTWTQLKPSRILKGDIDQRNYSDFFSDKNYISGLRKAFILTSLSKINEYKLDKISDSGANILVFEGMKDSFNPIMEYRQVIRDELFNMVNDSHKIGINDYQNSIGIHVRLGDFGAVDLNKLKQGNTNTKIPMEWYISTLRKIRENKYKTKQTAYVYSDGTDEELKLLLDEPNVKRVKLSSAISELLALTNSESLIASGSTFSMWACFLGDMDSYWYPGQLKFPENFPNSKKINQEFI